ncbi:MAG: choice-of-anchor J domain-containing protein [Prevotellaceae bacterium]|nr:choice-of-anchor J domain-containing protein [Prevotellaceae bacterium]
MKKHFSFIFAVAAAFAFTACEDIPAPYEINNNGGGTETDVLLSESFATSLGSFQSVTTVADYNWAVSYSCAQVTGYDSSTKENNDAESWLVSPVMDFSEVTSAHVSFDYILRYALAGTVAENHQILVSSDYQGRGKVGEATWEPLDFNLVQGSDWDTWYSSGNVNIPQKYMGGNVTVALRYKSTTAKASTWEVKNFVVVEGEGDYDPNGGGEDEGMKTLPYSEAFETTFGGFKSETTSGSGEWIIDFKTAKATGYDNASKVTTAGSYYLVSPEISLAGVSEAYVSYEYILRYNRADDNQQLLISADYTDAASTATWTPLCRKHTEGVDWTTFETSQIDIPAEYMGKTIRLAFYYNTNDVSGSTWEVRNFSIKNGKAGDNNDDEPSTEVGGLESFANGGFETWSGNAPLNWKTASTAGNASLSQSTDAHSGSYSVKVGGLSSANKRLGYKEMKLTPGTYTIKFYAKAATNAGGSVRPGYVPVKDGTVGAYVYGEYTNGLTENDWTLVTHQFEIKEECVCCLVIMNSKNPGADVLIDDFSISKQ